jgi:epoxide hydrolase
MRRLGYQRYGVHGGDVGGGVSGLVAALDGEHVTGLHVVTDPLTAAAVATFIPGGWPNILIRTIRPAS